MIYILVLPFTPSEGWKGNHIVAVKGCCMLFTSCLSYLTNRSFNSSESPDFFSLEQARMFRISLQPAQNRYWFSPRGNLNEITISAKTALSKKCCVASTSETLASVRASIGISS